MKPHVIIIGYVTAAMEGLAGFLAKPSPPSNWKDPVKIKEWHDTTGKDKIAEATHEAAYGKFTGRIREIFAVDPAAKETFFAVQGGSKSPAEQFAAWLEERYGRLTELFSSCPEERKETQLVFFGFDLKQFTRVLGTELIAEASRRVPMGLWYQNEAVYDPYDMLVESSRRGMFDLDSLLKLLNVEKPHPDWIPHQKASDDARVVAELLYRYQLYPSVYESEELSASEELQRLMLTMGQETADPPAAAIDPAGELGQNDPESETESLAEAVEEEAATQPETPARTPVPRARRPRPAAEQAG